MRNLAVVITVLSLGIAGCGKTGSGDSNDTQETDQDTDGGETDVVDDGHCATLDDGECREDATCAVIAALRIASDGEAGYCVEDGRTVVGCQAEGACADDDVTWASNPEHPDGCFMFKHQCAPEGWGACAPAQEVTNVCREEPPPE